MTDDTREGIIVALLTIIGLNMTPGINDAVFQAGQGASTPVVLVLSIIPVVYVSIILGGLTLWVLARYRKKHH